MAEDRVSSQAWDAGHELHQAIRNARPIPPGAAQRRLPSPVPVTAWLVWERDGLELLDTTATYWAGRDVLVELQSDPRWLARGVWLAAQDARRRGPVDA
jgi:hypothetical protein